MWRAVWLILSLALLEPSRSLDNGVGLFPPMGWNGWCSMGSCQTDYCNAEELMAIADAMANNGMKELGYEYINVDDCWADKRDIDGTIVPDKDRFPNGLVPVIKYINSKGFKFGLYTDAGLYTCQSGGRDHRIPGSYGHYEQDAKTYAEWGVEYVKMDWCSTNVSNVTLSPRIQYAQMSKALNMTGKPIFFNACEWGVEDPWEWMAQYANSWRSGPDHHDNWKSTAAIIEINADKAKYAGPGGWNDADFIMTGGEGCGNDLYSTRHCPGQTDVEYRTEFTMWCIIASPLIVSTNIRNMTAIMKEVLLNADLIAVSQDPLRQAGGRLGFSDCPQGRQYCQIWTKKLTGGENSYAVSLYNSGSDSSVISFKLSLLNLTQPLKFSNLWDKKHFFVLSDTMQASVAPHEAKVYITGDYKFK